MSLLGCVPLFHQDGVCAFSAHVEMKSKMPMLDNGIQRSLSYSKSVGAISQSKSLRHFENLKTWMHLTILETMVWRTTEGQTLHKQPDQVLDPYTRSWKYRVNQEIEQKIQEVIIKNPQLNYCYNKPYTKSHLYSW